jgi:exonuclease VII small subunit
MKITYCKVCSVIKQDDKLSHLTLSGQGFEELLAGLQQTVENLEQDMPLKSNDVWKYNCGTNTT